MTLALGTPMLRLDDGKPGLVEDVGGEPRIVYHDRADRLIAGKQEKWVPYAPVPTSRLRPEEMREVALEADRALRAIERHEPRRWWQPVDEKATPHDQGLVEVIVAYLAERA